MVTAIYTAFLYIPCYSPFLHKNQFCADLKPKSTTLFLTCKEIWVYDLFINPKIRIEG